MRTKHCCACRSKKNIHHHHLVPKSLGGTDDEKNILSLCNICHSKIHRRGKEFAVSALISKALQEKKGQGFVVGGLPFGYKIGKSGKRVQCSEQYPILKKILAYRDMGHGARKIEKLLNGKGPTISTIKRAIYRYEDRYDGDIKRVTKRLDGR